MKVFIFDLLAYGEQLDHLKIGSELPYPLSNRYFKADVAVRTYAEHLDAWEEMDRLGYDGVGFNEHHCSPYGLMNSPNLMAAAAAQRTKRLKLLIYGNLLPLHEPLRLAEELAMLDCLSNGRLISGFARGIPREYLCGRRMTAGGGRPRRFPAQLRRPGASWPVRATYSV
jgi:alkanesulfonate monooxygenase SsuD/methylene tetrahydromethanopterin reductase-like flavin-dependent oxidoreductase (luciferase family)